MMKAYENYSESGIVFFAVFYASRWVKWMGNVERSARIINVSGWMQMLSATEC